jgi:hypothetical protein
MKIAGKYKLPEAQRFEEDVVGILVHSIQGLCSIIHQIIEI